MQNHADFKKAQTTMEFMLGPIKIKDGLFMGDQLAAKVHLLALRISNSSSPIKLHTSSILSQKAFLISMNVLEFSIFRCTGLRRKKTYFSTDVDF